MADGVVFHLPLTYGAKFESQVPAHGTQHLMLDLAYRVPQRLGTLTIETLHPKGLPT